MKIKAVFMDLDGTTLREDLTISNRLKEKINELEGKGIKFFVSTGRSYKSSKPFVEELALKHETITYNGARIVSADDNESNNIYEQPLSSEIVGKLVKISREKGIHLNLYNDDELYVENNSEEAIAYSKSVGINYILEDFDEFNNKTSTKGLFIADNEILLNLKKELEQTISEVNYVFSKPHYLEVLNKNVNKGKAVEYVLEKYGISLDETMAFGDQWKDYEMLEVVKYGMLMENAPEELKKDFPKDRITLSNDEDGIVHMLEKIII